ncbi:MAG: STAS domain-containing protein [Halanaerobium sp.]
MLEESLKITYENGTAFLEFEGEVTFENSNRLKEEAKKQLSKKENLGNLIFDLSQVSYLDSSGVGVIFSLFKFMRLKDGTLAVVNPNDKIDRVFEVTKMKEIIPVYETIEETYRFNISPNADKIGD